MVCWFWVSVGDGVALVVTLFGCCCGDVFMIRKSMIFFTTFQSVPGSKKARHGAEQKFILFDENHPEKYESTNFFYELFLFGHPLSLNLKGEAHNDDDDQIEEDSYHIIEVTMTTPIAAVLFQP